MQFKDIIGQEELKSHLIQEINGGKISHSKLFLGKMGYGGLALALAYVQYLFCTNKTEKDSCNTCGSCIKIKDLQHADVHFSFPVVQSDKIKTSDVLIKQWRTQVLNESYFDLNTWSNYIDSSGKRPIISAHESLEIIKKLSLKSYEGNYKVMIIWMAEEMNDACANKLLKILEEPNDNTLFILLAENQEYMLPTILSRTQILNIPAIRVEELATFLNIKHAIEHSLSTSIASLSEGNLIEAIDLINENESKDFNREYFIELMRVCYKKDVLSMIDWSEKISTIGREKQKIFLKYALHMFRQSLLKNYTENQLTKISKEEDAFLEKFARFITGNNIFDFMEHFNDSYYHIERNANSKILFTNLCFKVMRYIHHA